MPLIRSLSVFAYFALTIVTCNLWMSACSVAAEYSLNHTHAELQPFENVEDWLKKEVPACIKGLKKNVTHPGTALGVVIASPSNRDPDYFFHWIRDAALVMSVVVDFYVNEKNTDVKNEYAKLIRNYVEFSEKNQRTPNRSKSLGEPKFHVDGSAFNGEWGRPQNDGPALRAVTLVQYAKTLLKEGGHEAWVRAHLYDGKLPADSVIKRDLEFVSHHWQEPSFDLWEEVKGQHFYTRMVQRRALLDGADLADALGDSKAAQWYRLQAGLLEKEIEKHWDRTKGHVLTTLDYSGGNPFKHSNIDTAVILAALHADRGDGYFAPYHERVLSTAYKLRENFAALYDINKKNLQLGVAIGRYPEDVYDGHSVSIGNPWVLTTAAFAQLHYQVAEEGIKAGKFDVTLLNHGFLNQVVSTPEVSSRNTPASRTAINLVPGQVILKGSDEFIQLIQKLRLAGDLYLLRVKYHAPEDGRLAEQINRTTGYMQGAEDLTWSYASIITANWSRDKLMRRADSRVQTIK
jgi:glucoamylase